MTRRIPRRVLGAATSVLLGSALIGMPVPASAAGPCGILTYNPAQQPTYDHVIVIMDENFSYSAFQKPGVAPFLHSLAAACGSETLMHAVTHPSQPNYMAATSGMATGVGAQTANQNVFNQLVLNGKSWRTYEESMPAPCSATQYTVAPAYKSGHNPAFWYNDLRTPTNTCALYDLAMSPALDNDLAADNLPALAWVSPNLCHDMAWDASCGYAQSSKVAAGDTWLSTFIPRLTALPSFQSGHTLVIVTVDEGGGSNAKGVDCTAPSYYSTHPDCQIPTIVLSAYIQPGTVDSADHNLYTLLGTAQDILGVARLGKAQGAGSLRPGLGF